MGSLVSGLSLLGMTTPFQYAQAFDLEAKADLVSHSEGTRLVPMPLWCLTTHYTTVWPHRVPPPFSPCSPFFPHCSLCWCQEFRGHFRATCGGQRLSGHSEARCRR